MTKPKNKKEKRHELIVFRDELFIEKNILSRNGDVNPGFWIIND